GNKRSTTWIGYKVHLTETCEADQVHLITNIETTPAAAADVDRTAPIHAALAAKGLLPGDHLVDAGFVDVELLVGSQFEHGVRRAARWAGGGGGGGGHTPPPPGRRGGRGGCPARGGGRAPGGGGVRPGGARG